jgi:signal recognition particle GTPase
MLNMEDLKAILAEASGKKSGDGKEDSVKDLSARLDTMEQMMAQLLQMSGVMPPEKQMPPMPAPEMAKQASASQLSAEQREELWRSEQLVKRQPILDKLRKLRA